MASWRTSATTTARDTFRARVRALRASALPVAQSAIAASLAWLIAHNLLGHPRAFFAPIAAVITLGVAPTYHTRRAIELVLGVAIGIAVADIVISVIGTGAWQIGFAVLVAMAAAILLGGGPLPVTQAAASAVLVATLAPPSHGFYTSRAIDAAVGGLVALGVLAALPGRPLRSVRRSAATLFGELRAVMEAIAAAVEAHDLEAAQAARARARGLDVATLLDSVIRQAVEAVRLSPPYWHLRDQVEAYADREPVLIALVQDVRAMARAATRVVDLAADTPPAVVNAIRSLGAVVGELGPAIEEGPREETLRRVLDAAGAATHAVDDGAAVATAALVGQVRSTAVDLLVALGIGRDDAIARLRAAADA
jgi:uncharacterized membrane protein YgaE (UPF0421/DUF939 family)